MNTNIFLPETIKVGYQERSDTYTKRLAYVIYYDNKGVLRKEKSWKSWTNAKLGNDEFKNEPTSGFVLNKGVGGARQSWGWNTRNEYIRVYDPRNFEFEISVANLLWILQETSSIKGKGLEGEFIYGWYGTELMLIPTCSQEYKECQEFTKLQDGKVSARDLKPGIIYKQRDMSEWIYLGRYLWYDHPYTYTNRYYDEDDKPSKVNKSAKKQHIFIKKEGRNGDNSRHTWDYIHINSMTKFKAAVSDEPVENLAFLIDDFFKLRQSCPFQKSEFRDITLKEVKKEFKDGYRWNSAIYYKDGTGYEFQQLHKDDKEKSGLDGDLKYITKGGSWYNYRGWNSDNRPLFDTITFEEVARDFKQKVEVYENGTAVHVNN